MGILPMIMTTLTLAATGPASAAVQARDAEVVFRNQRGAPTRWQLREYMQTDGATRTVERRWLDGERSLYVERVTLSATGVTRIEIADVRSGGTSATVRAESGRLTFDVAGGKSGAQPYVGEVLTMSTLGLRVADRLATEPTLREHLFVVPLLKARKGIPMRAQIVETTAQTVALRVRSTSVIVNTIYMREPFELTVDRVTGRVVSYRGMLEPWDLSDVAPKAIRAKYTFERHAGAR